MKSKRSKACDISPKVKQAVWERDGMRCIFCGTPYAMPNAHLIPRSKGGLGVERNIVTLCAKCHHLMDNSTQRKTMLEKAEKYLEAHYSDWNKEKLIYKKGD